MSNFVHGLGATAVIVGGVGGGAMNGLAARGIEVIAGVSGNAGDVLKSYAAGRLISGDPDCHGHHGGHDEGEHDGHGHHHGGLGAGGGELAVDDGVQPRIAPVDPFDRRVDELERGHLTASHKFGLGGRVLPGQLFVHYAPRSSPWPCAPIDGVRASQSMCGPVKAQPPHRGGDGRPPQRLQAGARPRW